MRIDDNIPYIIVDNRKIAPIRRVAPEVPLSHRQSSNDERPFGVVDRITISDAARKKFRQMEAMEDNDTTALTPPDKTSETRSLPFLSKSPKRDS